MSNEDGKQEVNDILTALHREDIKYEELEQKYDEWAEVYDHHAEVWGYNSPKVAVKEVTAILGSNKNARILDVCAGTGMTGQYLANAGYTNLDANDGSSAMLELAKKKNIYKKVYRWYLGDPLDEPNNSYDAVTTFGALCETHIRQECFSGFREIIRVTKSGGYFLAGMENGSVSDDYKKKVGAYFQKLIDEGLWEVVADKVTEEGSYAEKVWIYKIK